MKSPISIWRKSTQRFQLQGVKCVVCQATYYPVKYMCHCGASNFQQYHFSGNAILKTFTHIVMPPEDFKSVSPYCIGLVELEEGARFVAQLTDVMLDELKIGMELVAVFKKYLVDGPQGIISYGVKFIPKEKA